MRQTGEQAMRLKTRAGALHVLAHTLRALVLALLAQVLLAGALAQSLYHNPVMPGDHPDPTVVRVGRNSLMYSA